MKKTVLTLQLICLLSSLFLHYKFITAQQRNESKTVKLIVLMSNDYEEYRQALEGFENALKKSRIEYDVSLINDIKNDDFNPRVLTQINMIKPDLILALGTRALTNLDKYIKDIPVVFSMVLNPYLNNSSNSNNNITGITLSIPVYKQFSVFKEIVPKMKTIGVIYSQDENSELINEAKAAAKRLNLDLVAADVSNEREVPNAINNLTRIVDVLWLIVDKAVNSIESRKYIILECFRNDIPVMGPSETYAPGAVCAVRANYNNIGVQAGSMAVKILSGIIPSEIPFENPETFILYINEEVATSMGIKISEQIKKKAVIK